MMAEVAKDGLLPAKWHFYRHDAIGVAQNVVITQAVLVSLFALLYALPNINSVFLMLVNTAAFIYCTVYGIIGLAFIRVRYLLPNQERPFRIEVYCYAPHLFVRSGKFNLASQCGAHLLPGGLKRSKTFLKKKIQGAA